MTERLENEVNCKKRYVSARFEMFLFENSDIVTLSKDSQADNDVIQDDIFD